MRLKFRQGVVSHQSGFLSTSPSDITILTTNRPLIFTVAHGSANYLFEEPTTVTAWYGPFVSSKQYWLYLDYNPATLERTFGKTTTPPVTSNLAPAIRPVEIATLSNIVLSGLQVIDGMSLTAGDLVLVKNQTNPKENGVYTAVTGVWYRTAEYNTGNLILGKYFQSTHGTQIATYWSVDTITLNLITDNVIFNPKSSQDVSAIHWFNTIVNKMFVREQNGWREVIRVFAAKLINGTTPVSVSVDYPLFTGSQVSINDVRLDSGNQLYNDQNIGFDAGHPAFDSDGNPIRKKDGSFFNSSEQFYIQGSRITSINPESSILQVICDQAGLNAFSVCAYSSLGRIRTAQYEDSGAGAVSIITEDLIFGQAGSAIVQGTIINQGWNWIEFNKPLWINNGALVSIDPFVSNPTLHPVQRPPVARVLNKDQIIFMQGLGLKGDTGNTGGAANIPQATNLVYGVVKLNQSDLSATVVVNNDSRMSDARTPLSHTQPATSVTFAPISNISDNNVQGAITTLESLISPKLNKSGDIMTGLLTLSGNPTTNLHAATKQYVDGFILGITVKPPVNFSNIISDTEINPPVVPNSSDIYLVPTGATGVWVSLVNHLVKFDGASWVDLGLISSFPIGSRFGIAIETSTLPSGLFAGKKNQIAILSGSRPTIWSFELPVKSDLFYINNIKSSHAFHQYVFDGLNWNEFGQPMPVEIPPPGPLDSLSDVTLINPSSGQILSFDGVDWKNVPNDDAVITFQIGVAPPQSTHNHFAYLTRKQAESLITGTALSYDITSTSQSDHFHIITVTYDNINAIFIVINITNNLLDKHVGLRANFSLVGLNDVTIRNPRFGDILKYDDYNQTWYNGQLPLITLGSLDSLSDVTIGNPQFGDILKYNDYSQTWYNAPQLTQQCFNFPYDLAFFLPTAPIDINAIVGGFAIPRAMTLTNTFSHVAYCLTPPNATLIFGIYRNNVQIGTVTFPNGLNTGTFFWNTSIISLIPGNIITLKTTGTVNSAISGIGITLIAVTQICQV